MTLWNSYLQVQSQCTEYRYESEKHLRLKQTLGFVFLRKKFKLCS